MIAPERIESFLQGLPVDALWGVGPKTAERLRAHGIDKLVDVRARSLDELRADRRQLGASGCATWRVGKDDRPVEPNQERKSCGSECTYEKDLTDLARIREEIDEMARDAARWLEQSRAVRAHGRDQSALRRLHDHHAQSQRPAPDARCRRDCARACALLDKTDAGRRPVRLLGVSVHNLEESDRPQDPPLPRDEDPRLPLE